MHVQSKDLILSKIEKFLFFERENGPQARHQQEARLDMLAQDLLAGRVWIQWRIPRYSWNKSQTSDNMDRWKAEIREEKRRRKKIKKRKSQKKEDPGARKGRKVAKHCVFPMVCGSGGSISRLAKAAGAEPAGQMTDEKLHAVVARSTFPSQNVQSTSASEHF